ncbi:MAG: hypothetical protein ACE5JH_06390 [Acidobacteriota bacterium]
MLRAVQRIAGVLIAAQGIGHAFLGTPMFFKALGQDAVWFAGAGFAMIFLGLLNLAPADALPRWLRWAVLSANALWLTLMLGLLATSSGARVIAAVAFAAGCLVGSAGGIARAERPS